MSQSNPLASQMFAQQNAIAPVMTDDEIAGVLGISKARVFQLRMQAMGKIREAVLGDENLRDYVEEMIGRRLPPLEQCDRCESTTDVRDVMTREGKSFDQRAKRCKECRIRANGKVRLIRTRDLVGAGP